MSKEAGRRRIRQLATAADAAGPAISPTRHRAGRRLLLPQLSLLRMASGAPISRTIVRDASEPKEGCGEAARRSFAARDATRLILHDPLHAVQLTLITAKVQTAKPSFAVLLSAKLPQLIDQLTLLCSHIYFCHFFPLCNTLQPVARILVLDSSSVSARRRHSRIVDLWGSA